MKSPLARTLVTLAATLVLGYAGFLALFGNLLPAWAGPWSDGPLRTRFARRPPAEAYERVFNTPVPADVTNLRATGEVWLGGMNIWLRFRAGKKTIQALTGGGKGDPAVDMLNHWKFEEIAAQLKNHDPDDHVQWDEVFRARKRVRSFSPSDEMQLYVDPRDGTVYVYLLGS